MAAEAVVSFLIKRFGNFILNEAKSFSKSANHNKIQRLERELKRMQCFLKDADAKQDLDQRVRQKVAEIRDLVCDADVIFDRYELKISSKNNDSGRKRFRLFGESRTLRKLGSEIDEIIGRVAELITALQTYDIKELKADDLCYTNSKEKQRRKLRRTFSHVIERDIVGLEEQTLKLLIPLLGDQRTSHVVSICGMGGLGKTTLAKTIYHHEKVRGHFECFAWACISQQWDVREIWEGILIRLTSPCTDYRNRISKFKDDELAKELYELQWKTKCLVVLDDIWEVDAWDSLSAGFPQGNITGSKILLTSRNIEVAQHVDPKGFIHKPTCLSESESWELFVKTAIHGRESTGFVFDENLKKLGRKMLKHCGGLPLAIKILGGIMATKHTTDEWRRVYDDVKIHIRGKDQVKEIFGLSYNDLPYHLKPCFLYFSPYQEDAIIDARQLIEIWMAEGFIPSSYADEGGKEMEDIAEENLEQLVLRCMVQIERKEFGGKIKTCKIHDVMRDLCIQQAKREGFFHFLCDGNSPSYGKVRRLISLGDSYENIAGIGNKRYCHVRSIVLYFSHELSKIFGFKRFKLLRVLVLQYVKGEIPEEIGELIHLRLLDFTSSSISKIPSSIGNLSLLLTLRAQTQSYLEIPDVIVKLKRLRHLYLSRNAVSLSGKLQIANLSSLQTLVCYPGEHLDPNEWATLSSLRKLKTDENDKWVEVFHSSLGNTFDNLQSLSMKLTCLSNNLDLQELGLCCPSLFKLSISSGKISLWDANHHFHFLQNLTKLKLRNSDLDINDPMPSLGKLPNLTVLIMRGIVQCDAFVCPANSFPRLQSLVIIHLSQFGEWIIEEGALQCLRHIRIDSCPMLKEMPEGFRFIRGLKELEIIRASHQLQVRARTGGEDFYKIQHVPRIIIT